MTAVPPELKPLREALLRQARRDADAVIAVAAKQAAEQLAAATAAADARVGVARQRGEAEAASALVAEEAKIRQEARTLILQAERSVYDELRTRTRDRVRQLRDDNCYPLLRSRLEADGRARLGSDAVCRDDPRGGCVIEADGKRIEATLDTLADWAVDALGVDALGVDVPAGATP
jgi:vacuolar-type H+-ATPase subunit E/Vma4